MKDFNQDFDPVEPVEFPIDTGEQLNIEVDHELEIPDFVFQTSADVEPKNTQPKVDKMKLSDYKINQNPIFWLCFTIITSYVTLFVSKNNYFPELEKVVFFIFCGIISIVVPIFVIKRNISFASCDKNVYRFTVLFSLGISALIECITFYICGDGYFDIVRNSNFYAVDIQLNLAILLSFIYILCVFAYFNIIYSMLEKNISHFYNILICTLSMSMILSQNLIKNIAFCFLLFYIRKVFSSVLPALIFLVVGFGVNVVFELLFIKYFMFNIMQYFVFGFIILAFILLDKSIVFFDKNEFYGIHSYPKIELPTKADLKIIYFGILFFAIYLVSFLEV